MFRTLRVRVVMAALVALLGLSIVGHTLPDAVPFVGDAYADDCTGTGC